MRLRNLERKDAGRMLDWMKDSCVVSNLQKDFKNKTIDDCIDFITNSCDDENVNLAIVDDNDVYMGTVSLKHINANSAEFAIVVCKDAMGKGYSIWAMREILKKGFEELGVNSIYWCVSKDNHRALRFYDKYNFIRIDSREVDVSSGYTEEQMNSYVWYLATA